MAARGRRRQPKQTKKKRKKSKLVLLLLPIAILVAILGWLFREQGAGLFGSRRPQTTAGKSPPKTNPKTSAGEKILDPERKKLDEILKNR